MNKKASHGSVVIIVIIVGFLLIVGVAAASYYLLWSQQALPEQINKQYTSGQTGSGEVGTPSMKPISDSDSLKDIEAELESTSEGSIDADINSLNSSASSL